MDTPQEYIKHVIVKCQARYTIYHTNSGRWAKAHWTGGVVNGILSATVALLSFIAQQNGWSNTETGMIGGLVLTLSNIIMTSLKTGQHQVQNEKAGDAYRNLENKIRAEYSDDSVDYDLLKDRCQEKLEKLTNLYSEPDPQKCLALEEKLYVKMFPVEQV